MARLAPELRRILMVLSVFLTSLLEAESQLVAEMASGNHCLVNSVMVHRVVVLAASVIWVIHLLATEHAPLHFPPCFLA